MADFKHLKSNILAYIKRHKPNSRYSSWYIGITNNIKQTKKRHENNFNLKNLPCFHYWHCNNVNQSEILETYFIRQYGFSGSEGGSSHNTNKIYIFFKGRKKSNN